jgi:hypothetical protein
MYVCIYIYIYNILVLKPANLHLFKQILDFIVIILLFILKITHPLAPYSDLKHQAFFGFNEYYYIVLLVYRNIVSTLLFTYYYRYYLHIIVIIFIIIIIIFIIIVIIVNIIISQF